LKTSRLLQFLLIANSQQLKAVLLGKFPTDTYLCAPFPTWPNKCPPERDRQQGVIARLFNMPKVKTNSSAKKRFKVTGTGEITFQKAFKRHILTKKSTKRKRALRKKGLVGSTNKDFVLRLLRLKG
jgi:large subunit ribosomal protein L35